MKKLLYFLIPIVFVSCSDTGSTQQQANEKKLYKTVSFNYQDGVLFYKKIVYYENGRESLDSLFNGDGLLLMHKSYSHTATTTLSSGTNDITGDAISNEIQYDPDHRMLSVTEKQNGVNYFVTTYTYDGPTVLKHTEYANGTTLQDYAFEYGSGGYLTQMIETSGGSGFSVQVAAQKAVGFYSVLNDINYFVADIGYYSVEVPQALKKSVDDINNIILWESDVAQAGISGNFYIQSFWNRTYESTFDAENYITSRRETINQAEPVVNELFYFYTEE